MNTTTTTAAAEAAKNLAIYNAVADHARHAFEYLNIKPGQYTPAQIVAELKKSRAAWKDNAPAVGDEGGLVRVAVDAFACQFPLLNAFDVLAQLATAYDIPTRDRVTFERAAETAPAVVSFMVPTAAADVAKAVAKKAPDREALTFAYIDTERRALVGTDGHVLTVAAVPSLQVAEGARRGYLVARGLLKADRVTIDTNNNATDGHNVAESPEWLRFPVWSPVFPDVYDTDALTIDNATRRALTKAVAAAAKYATPDLKDTRHVAIFGEAGTDRLTIRARREIATPTAEDPHAVKYEYMDTAVQLPATLSRSLAFAFHGPDFATLPAFDTLYITPNESRAAVVISKRAAAVLVPQPLPDGYDRICKTDERPAFAVQLHPLADLLDVYTDAPDTLTAAPAADGHQDTPAEWCPLTGQYLTPADHLTPDEIRALVAAERERLADTINTDTDPDAPAFAVGEAFELLTDTGATVAACVRSQYYNDTDDTAAPCWLYLCDCDPWTDRHGVTIDGGTYDAARMRKAAAPAADGHQDTPATTDTTTTPAEVISESEPTAAAPAADGHQDTPAAVVAAADLLARADVRDAAKAIAKAKTADDTRATRDAFEARRLLTREGLTLTDYRIKTADGLTLCHFIYSYGKKSRRTLCAPLLKVAAEFATLSDLLAEFAELMTISESESQDTTTAADVLAPADHQDTPAEVISEDTTPAPAADDSQTAPTADPDTIDTPEADTATTCEAVEVAPVLFTADGDTFRRGDRVIMTCLYYSDRAEVVGTLTDKERGGSTAEVTDDTGRKFYGWYAGVKHATAEVISESEDTTPAAAADDSQNTPADGHQSESEADALPVTFYDPAAGVIVWGLADELPTADGLTAESVTAADLLTIESERESAAPADGHQDTTTTAHDSESRPRALLLTLTRAALRLAAVVAALLLLTFANDRPTPATATTTAADLLAPADHQDTPAEVISESESADTLTTTPAEVISEPTESEPTARPAADRPAVEKRHHARKNKRESRAELMTAAAPADLLTADTLTTAPVVVDRDSLTAPAVVISESESQDTTTTRRPLLLTADELAELLALLTGTTTAESVTAAPAADDSQDTPADVISEPTESEPTAAPADGHQDTPATTGTTTPAAPAAGCPAAVATPCPPAAPVAPVAPIIL